MKKLIIIIISCFILVGCEQEEVRQGRALYKAYFNKYLKDPESLRIYDEAFSVSQKDDNTVYWTIDYGAKNDYGAYVRRTVRFTTVCDAYIQFGENTYYTWDLDIK